jgi:hypothetical protein
MNNKILIAAIVATLIAGALLMNSYSLSTSEENDQLLKENLLQATTKTTYTDY